LSRSIVINFWATETSFTGTRNQESFSRLWPLSLRSWRCYSIVFSFEDTKKQSSPGFETRISFRSLDVSVIPSWFRVSIPNLMQIGVFIQAIRRRTQTYNFNFKTYKTIYEPHTKLLVTWSDQNPNSSFPGTWMKIVRVK
jgi:hypothetical protein